ncbi:hypothetical protein GQ43DRAFT_434376 [Delitschia confertaspora ATCC 74209]|uniref:Uncharacterized protein n=1 Tax=Delitschia confertaspora ATCC 74209 TaxID=1513339 RepID=A0A9P4JF93_9PLEO|nr:hypothetical protein GQ43DRAFT_434376 [Delitschia confertaspora ATCC 74209]
MGVSSIVPAIPSSGASTLNPDAVERWNMTSHERRVYQCIRFMAIAQEVVAEETCQTPNTGRISRLGSKPDGSPMFLIDQDISFVAGEDTGKKLFFWLPENLPNRSELLQFCQCENAALLWWPMIEYLLGPHLIKQRSVISLCITPKPTREYRYSPAEAQNAISHTVLSVELLGSNPQKWVIDLTTPQYGQSEIFVPQDDYREDMMHRIEYELRGPGAYLERMAEYWECVKEYHGETYRRWAKKVFFHTRVAFLCWWERHFQSEDAEEHINTLKDSIRARLWGARVKVFREEGFVMYTGYLDEDDEGPIVKYRRESSTYPGK